MKQMCVSNNLKKSNRSVILHLNNLDPKILHFSHKNRFSLIVILEHAPLKMELRLFLNACFYSVTSGGNKFVIAVQTNKILSAKSLTSRGMTPCKIRKFFIWSIFLLT